MITDLVILGPRQRLPYAKVRIATTICFLMEFITRGNTAVSERCRAHPSLLNGDRLNRIGIFLTLARYALTEDNEPSI
jgi:hypothetical protein